MYEKRRLMNYITLDESQITLDKRKTMLDEMSRDKAKQEGEACRRFQSRVDVEMVDILVEWTQESARKRK